MGQAKGLVYKPIYWLFVVIGLLGWLPMFFGTDDPQLRSRLIGLGVFSFFELVILPIISFFASRRAGTSVRSSDENASSQ